MTMFELLVRFKEWDEDCESGCMCLGCDLLREAAADEPAPDPEPHSKDCLCDECMSAWRARQPGETRREYKLRTGMNP